MWGSSRKGWQMFSMVASVLLLSMTAQAQMRRAYPASRHGGNYMHNFYFPPAPSSTPWAPDWSPYLP